MVMISTHSVDRGSADFRRHTTAVPQADASARIALTSGRLERIPNLEEFLGQRAEFASRIRSQHTAVAGWGAKPSGLRARAMAGANLPFMLLEDGFLRSVGRSDPPLSLVVDDLGIYYDATGPSRLEKLIAEPLTEAENLRAGKLMALWRDGRVSKYNHARDYDGALPPRFVLVCDQTYGDASVAGGLADHESFQRMLDAALAENPDCTVLVKTHPDIITRNKRGYFERAGLQRNPRARIIAEACHPVRLIEEAEAVYVVTSQIGFEALIRGKPTRCFGMPFYAGWGLTCDELPFPERRGRATLAQVVHAALVSYPRYVDPETGRRSDAEKAITFIARQRQMRERFAPRVYALGFSRWKRPILKRFLSGSEVRFERRASRIPPNSTVVLWGSHVPQLPEGTRTIRIEDGFLRSVGLGAELAQPLSWVCDDLGIYYDASKPSRLEDILANVKFDAATLERAASLRKRILEAGLTKYNADTAAWQRPRGTRRVILVPGQVETDASIRYGTAAIQTNLDLLRAVRAANPDSYIVYKPHPDIVAGLRKPGETENSVPPFCNEIVVAADMARLLDKVDEVHTLTSLTGFEALMRDVPVTCYGRPFYAGWGLTRDMTVVPRRQRQLDLDALLAASLILYPTYVSRSTGVFATPEQATAELIGWRNRGPGKPSRWRQAWRAFLRLGQLFPSRHHMGGLTFMPRGNSHVRR
ncbi:MAG: capsular polysaccharide biosynthesis protein [Alphaproteobacteria bacterium]|nr:capsular polysaccharide biosynthesis protein [Alphaproteobacteria bacterium]